MCDPAKYTLYIPVKNFHFFHSVEIAFFYSYLSFQILPLHLEVTFLEVQQADVSFRLEEMFTLETN